MVKAATALRGPLRGGRRSKDAGQIYSNRLYSTILVKINWSNILVEIEYNGQIYWSKSTRIDFDQYRSIVVKIDWSKSTGRIQYDHDRAVRLTCGQVDTRN